MTQNPQEWKAVALSRVRENPTDDAWSLTIESKAVEAGRAVVDMVNWDRLTEAEETRAGCVMTVIAGIKRLSGQIRVHGYAPEMDGKIIALAEAGMLLSNSGPIPEYSAWVSADSLFQGRLKAIFKEIVEASQDRQKQKAAR